MKRIRMPKGQWDPDKVDFDQDYEESVNRSLAKDRKKFLKRSKRGTPGGYYAHTAKWFSRNIPLDPVLLQKRLDSNAEYQRLQRLLAIPIEKRRTKMSQLVLRRDMPAIYKKLNELQAKIDPLVRELMRLDRLVRIQSQRAEFVVYRSRTVTPETNASIHKRIAACVKHISDGIRRQAYEKERLKLRKARGFWQHIKNKYKNAENPPQNDTDQKRTRILRGEDQGPERPGEVVQHPPEEQG